MSNEVQESNVSQEEVSSVNSTPQINAGAIRKEAMRSGQQSVFKELSKLGLEINSIEELGQYLKPQVQPQAKPQVPEVNEEMEALKKQVALLTEERRKATLEAVKVKTFSSLNSLMEDVHEDFKDLLTAKLDKHIKISEKGVKVVDDDGVQLTDEVGNPLSPSAFVKAYLDSKPSLRKNSKGSNINTLPGMKVNPLLSEDGFDHSNPDVFLQQFKERFVRPK